MVTVRLSGELLGAQIWFGAEAQRCAHSEQIFSKMNVSRENAAQIMSLH